jgi:hypothetical protein
MSRILSPILVLSLAAVTAGCGGGKPASQGVAHLTSTTTTTAAQGTSGSKSVSPQAFSRCMRSHGVPQFPDPKIDADGNAQLSINGGPGSGLDPESPQFKAAGKACQKLQPGGEGKRDPAMEKQQLGQMLKFSGCMRSHGLPDFPDPKADGGGISLMLGKGMNPKSPLFQAAQKACEKLMPKPPKDGKGGNLSSSGPGAK